MSTSGPTGSGSDGPADGPETGGRPRDPLDWLEADLLHYDRRRRQCNRHGSRERGKSRKRPWYRPRNLIVGALVAVLGATGRLTLVYALVLGMGIVLVTAW